MTHTHTHTHTHTILSLCDYTGTWSAPYRAAGYNVVQLDLRSGRDVRLCEFPGRVHGILAAPPCTHFASSGARWWSAKGDAALLEGLAVVDACLRFVACTRPQWWCLENPVGRLKHYLGPARYTFHPAEFAGYADDPASEAYTKRTCLWGVFNIPEPRAVAPVLGSALHRLPPSADRGYLRSITPSGFARAFASANP